MEAAAEATDRRLGSHRRPRHCDLKRVTQLCEPRPHLKTRLTEDRTQVLRTQLHPPRVLGGSRWTDRDMTPVSGIAGSAVGGHGTPSRARPPKRTVVLPVLVRESVRFRYRARFRPLTWYHFALDRKRTALCLDYPDNDVSIAGKCVNGC